MKLNFPTTTFEKKKMKDFDCFYFIFQYKFNQVREEGKLREEKGELILQCYPASQSLKLLGDPFPCENSWEKDPVKVKKGFVIGNITVPKEDLKHLLSGDKPTILITPVFANAEKTPGYVSIQLDDTALVPIIKNPSPPAGT